VVARSRASRRLSPQRMIQSSRSIPAAERVLRSLRVPRRRGSSGRCSRRPRSRHFRTPIVNANGDARLRRDGRWKRHHEEETARGLWWVWSLSNAPMVACARAGNFAPEFRWRANDLHMDKNSRRSSCRTDPMQDRYSSQDLPVSVSRRRTTSAFGRRGTPRGGVAACLLRTGRHHLTANRSSASTLLSTVPGAIGASRGYNARGSVVTRVLFPKGAQSIVRIDIPQGKVRILSDSGPLAVQYELRLASNRSRNSGVPVSPLAETPLDIAKFPPTLPRQPLDFK
jgi:hypothetical protein